MIMNLQRLTRLSVLALAFGAFGSSFSVQADELIWVTTNWHNSSTDRSVVHGGSVPMDREIADDFEYVGPIKQIVAAGGGCWQCPTVNVLGVYVRFYEWTEDGPGVLQEEYFLDGDDPNFDYNRDAPALLIMTLEEEFQSAGRHFVSVQLNFDNGGGLWEPGIAGRANPKVGPCYFRDNLGTGEWVVEIDYLGYETDVQFELWGPGVVDSPWESTPVPNTRPAHLWGVKDVDGLDNVWAVGFEKEYYNQFSYDSYSFAARWNGSQWVKFNTPSPGLYSGGGIDVQLNDVAGAAGDDVWAVGSYKTQHPQDGFVGYQTIAMHFDGSDWSQVPTPVTPPGMSGAFLWAVEAPASDNVFAVGNRVDPNQLDQIQMVGHALRWDGSEWEMLPDAPPLGRRNDLVDLAMIDSDRFIAIGGHSGPTLGARDKPYVVQWDGNSWSHIEVPVPDGQVFLESVAVLAPDNIWIAGTSDPFDAPFKPLFLHYDGQSWVIFDAVEFTPYGGTIRSITAIAPDDIWASGTFTTTMGGFTRPLLMHFDGTSWRQVYDDPDDMTTGTLFAIDAVGDTGEVWTVGSDGNNPYIQRNTGSGEASVAAPLAQAQVTFGQLVSGGITELAESDNAVLRARSRFGFTAVEPNLLMLEVTSQSPLANTSEIDLQVESRINHPSGTATVRMRNFSSNQWQTLGVYSIGLSEDTVSYPGIDAANRVTETGEIRVQIKLVVPAVFTALGFDAFFDLIEFAVR